MLKIGLTGNLGSGKSVVAGIFRILKVPVYNADKVSKRFLPDAGIQNKIRSAFGAEVFQSDGRIDRKALAGVVFNDPQKLAVLNSILHPLVREDFRKWCILHQDEPYVIQEAAIIFESGFRSEYDRIIHVSCPEEVAIQRTMLRDHVTREEVQKRLAFQWEDKRKAAISDYIILNDGSELVIPQVLQIHNEIAGSSRRK